jgi:hypothetical protein
MESNPCFVFGGRRIPNEIMSLQPWAIIHCRSAAHEARDFRPLHGFLRRGSFPLLLFRLKKGKTIWLHRFLEDRNAVHFYLKKR